MYTPKPVISSTEEIRSILGEVYYSQDTKCIDHIDAHCRAWIERAPLVVVASMSGSGQLDVAPKGDPAGSFKVLDEQTLAIPDRPGNNRADTLINIIENPRIGLMFVIPNRREVVRVSGSAQITTDPDLVESMTVNGKSPKLVILVHVEEAMFHCGKAFIRAKMWEPEKWQSVAGLPTYAQTLIDHGKLTIATEDLQKGIESNDKILF
ncbi:MAG: MSMEG_1061 family FMN-dependent PPOX-type flavoprotein [Pseudomonadota bacterium]|nr:MSMEG_1061 family FMN-dependent PPOX-type flavoprotein [Pseudomonadota bacterium]